MRTSMKTTTSRACAVFFFEKGDDVDPERGSPLEGVEWHLGAEPGPGKRPLQGKRWRRTSSRKSFRQRVDSKLKTKRVMPCHGPCLCTRAHLSRIFSCTSKGEARGEARGKPGGSHAFWGEAGSQSLNFHWVSGGSFRDH